MIELTTADREALITAVRTIEKRGGPQWYEWCDLENGLIYNPDPEAANNRDNEVECQPAVAAAVVMYCGDAWAWTKSQRIIPGAVFATADIEGKGQWHFARNDSHSVHHSQLAASLALITAVADALEEA